MAQELWCFHISANQLIPGPVITEMSRDTQDERRESAFAIDSAWIKSPEDGVPLALFLAAEPDVGPTVQSISLMRRDARTGFNSRPTLKSGATPGEAQHHAPAGVSILARR